MDTERYAKELLAEMYSRAKAQFGSAIKAHWFYASEACPGCQRPVDTMKHKGRDALSLNAFIYRERGEEKGVRQEQIRARGAGASRWKEIDIDAGRG